MRIVMIAAIGTNRVIGAEAGGLPWDLPADRRHFRARTAGRALLLGRRTFEEMSGWFRDHRPIVLSGDPSYAHPEAAATATSIDKAVAVARDAWEEDELLVCGGASIYGLALPFADELVITHVEAAFRGSTRFPRIEDRDWTRVECDRHPADSENTHAFTIVRYVRRN